MDTRLTWTFGDDDFLHATGELVPLSPTFSVGDRPQYRLFFDNLNSRFAGRENLTHLVLYKKMPGFIENLTTEAALVLRFDIAELAANTGNVNTALYDSGSYIRVFYQTGGDARRRASRRVFFPLDTDRFRLGYLYDISWGGTAASINQSIFPRIQGASPGLKVQYDSREVLRLRRLQDGDDRPARAGAQPRRRERRRDRARRRDELRLPRRRGRRPARQPPLRRRRRLLPAGQVRPPGRARQARLHVRRLGRVVVPPRTCRCRSRSTSSSTGTIRTAPLVLFTPEKYDPDQVAWSVSAEVDCAPAAPQGLRRRGRDEGSAGARAAPSRAS